MKITQLFSTLVKATDVIRALFGALKQPDTYKSLTETDVLLCCHDGDRGETLRGQAYSRLIDSVSEDLVSRGWRCSQFAFAYSKLIGKQAFGNPVSANRVWFIGLALERLGNILSRIGFRTDCRVIRYCREYRSQIFVSVIEKTKPRCIITIGAPSELCRVGRVIKIPVIELLHGNGIPLVPWGWDRRDAVNLPSGILSLDDVSTKTFSVLKPKGVDVRQIPDPWLSRFSQRAEKSGLPAEWRESLNWIPQRKKIIIVSLAWGYDHDHGPYTEFANILTNGLIHEELIDAIEQTHDSCFWLIRRHPVQMRSSKYDVHVNFLDKLTAQNVNCEWKNSSSLPLPQLLNCCDGHVTMMSVSAYDAAFMGVPTLLLCPTLRPGGANEMYFKDLRTEGYAVLGEFNTKTIQKWAVNTTRSEEPFHSKLQQDWPLAVKWMMGSEIK
jgi:hypothetical protein